MQRQLRFWMQVLLVGSLFSVLTGPACPTHQPSLSLCSGNADCPSGQYCNSLDNCQVVNETCDAPDGVSPTESSPTRGCCPGQACNVTVSQCVDEYLICRTDADCVLKGQVCNPQLGEYPVGPGCTFQPCGASNECPSPLVCFNSYCVGEVPCRGGCPAGLACTPVNDECYPPGATASCQQTCGTGSMLVLTDGRNVFSRCDFSQTGNCECAAIPTF